MIEMTPRQKLVLEVLARREYRQGASLQVLADELGMAGESGVRALLGPLLDVGLVERRELSERFKPALITNAGRGAIGLQPLPRVLEIVNAPLAEPMPVNPVSCGPLRATASEPSRWVEYLGDIFENFRVGDQLLIAEGDSMVSPTSADESIFDGDRCLLRPDVWPSKGEVAYVEYVLPNGCHEGTLKQWQVDENTGQVCLRAFNPRYPDIIAPVEQVAVGGIVLEVIRSVKRARSRHCDTLHANNGHANGQKVGQR